MPKGDGKKRLVVLKDDDGEPPRPPWQWVGFGVAAIFGAWVPLAWIAELARRAVERRLLGPGGGEELAARAVGLAPADQALLTALSLGFPLLGLSAAGAFGGYLVGRYGGRAGARHAALAGVAAGLGATALTWVLFRHVSAEPLVAVAPLAIAALLGGRWGVARRS